jgi:hypothetical protein
MTQQEPIFRASYSILNMWKSGNWEMAVKAYFKMESFTSEQMADGKIWHDKWRAETEATLCLPEIFGGKKLRKPLVEQKYVVNLHPWLNLVGVIDCLDAPTIYEYKTGKESSESYANSRQIGVYGVLATYAGHYVDRAEIYRYDQYKKQSDMSVVWITEKLLNDSFNWIDTLSSEMHDYFLQNNLYNRFGHNLVKK